VTRSESQQEAPGVTMEHVRGVVEQKFGQVRDMLTQLAGQSDRRFTNLETERMEERRILQQLQQGMEGQRQQIIGLAQARNLNNSSGSVSSAAQGDMINILDGLRDEFEALARQHQWALGAISAQRDQHDKFAVTIEELRRGIADSLASQQDHLEDVVTEMRRGMKESGVMALERSEVVNSIKQELVLLQGHMKDLKTDNSPSSQHKQIGKDPHSPGEWQQSEVFLLRQEVEKMRALETMGEHMQKLQVRQEEIAKSQEGLEASLRADVTQTIEAINAERRSRESELSDLAAFVRAEHYARTRDKEEMSQLNSSMVSAPGMEDLTKHIDSKIAEEREARVAVGDSIRSLWVAVDSLRGHVDELVIDLAASKEDCMTSPKLQRQVDDLVSKLSVVEKAYTGKFGTESNVQATVDELAETVQAEVAKRCSLVSELHGRIARESAEVTQKIEIARNEMLERVNEEVNGLRAQGGCSGEGLRAASSNLDRQDEQTQQLTLLIEEVSRDLCQLAKALQEEHDARIRDCCELREQLAFVRPTTSNVGA